VIAAGILAPGWTKIPTLVAGVPLTIIGWASAVAIRLTSVLTRDVPANSFGICTGIGAEPKKNPGFTDWLADKIDEAAGLPLRKAPLTFGQLRAGRQNRSSDDHLGLPVEDDEQRDKPTTIPLSMPSPMQKTRAMPCVMIRPPSTLIFA
jgi:hypothetical protein